MTKRPNIDEYDQRIYEYDKTVIGFHDFDGEIIYEVEKVELDELQKDYKNSEVLIAIKEMQS